MAPESPAQTAGDLRTLVLRRVGSGARVALLASDAALVRGLEAAGCAVLEDPDGLEALAAFAPTVVVAFDGLLQGGEAALGALVRAAPGATLVLSFENAASAASLLQALIGKAARAGCFEREVSGWLAAQGLAVVARDVVLVPHAPTGLSADAEAQLRALLEQVNPDAAADRVLCVARPGAPAPAAEPVEGLLSVVVGCGPQGLEALGRTGFSLERQAQQPFEVLVVGPHPQAALEEAAFPKLGRAQQRALCVEGEDPAARFNAGLRAASGQYLAFLEAGERVDALHFSRSVQALRSGTAAWSLTRTRRAGGVNTEATRFSLMRWLQEGAVDRCALVLDRNRLGPFPLAFAQGIPAFEALLFARLGCLFPPAFLAGEPSVERADVPAAAQQLFEAMRARPLRALLPLEALVPPPVAPEQALAQAAGEVLERRAPALARGLKELAERVRKPKG